MSRYANYPDSYGDPSWFVHDRFGMFIHWGLYSLAARHEWVMNRESIAPGDYESYFRRFDPDLFDPGAWADVAVNAGMRYVVVTTKHHEGFALWDSSLTDYKATNTPARRDLLREIVDAFRARGLRIGFYHSLIDWHHPEFPVDGLHPLRAQATPGERDISKYRQYLHGQVRELLTGYGTVDYLWFDFSYPQLDWGWSRGKGPSDWGSQDLERLVLELQPGIVLNDRLGLNRGVVTPEQYQPASSIVRDGRPVLWEACQTLNGSWGYDRDNLDFKSSEMIVQMLADTVSKGGNLLLNVGPNARGELDARSRDILARVGEWMRLHSRSIYGAGPAQYAEPPNCLLTRRDARLYLHLFTWPFGHVHLPGLAGRVGYAQLLNDASEIRIGPPSDHASHLLPAGARDVLTLRLPVRRPDVAVPVIELFLDAT